MKPKAIRNTNDLCHCCSATSIVDIIYTKYGAKITLCKECIDEAYGQYLFATFNDIATNILKDVDWSGVED